MPAQKPALKPTARKAPKSESDPHAGDKKLTVPEVAERAEIKPKTWTSYVAREQAPPPDGHFDGRTPWWWESTIDTWRANRPGPGARLHRRRKAST